MENATKALLIAAAVLIAIVLIAIGISILNSAGNVTGDVDKVSEAMGISVFNSQFTDYVGTQNGTQVKAVLSKVAATHRNNSTRKVVVTSGGTTYDTADEIAGFMSTLRVTTNYTVGVTYNDEGYVSSVTVN